MARKEITLTKIPISTPVARLIRGDNASTVLCMTVDRYDGGVDLSELTWMINVVNAENVFDTYQLEKVMIENETIYLEWLIGGVATSAEGDTQFELEGVRDGDSAIVWQSGTRVLKIYPDISGLPQDVESEELSEVAQLIAYVNHELPTVLAARDEANEAAQHPPVPGSNGNWWVWNAANDAYNDTGMPWTGSGEGGSSGGNGLPYVSAADDGKVAMVVNGAWAAAELPLYDGVYSVTPSATEEQMLATAQKLMNANLVVAKIPFSEVSNTANGKTATIG